MAHRTAAGRTGPPWLADVMITILRMTHGARDARRRPGAGETGFSLIEILAAVAVLAVVTAMAVPLTEQKISSLRVRGDARGIFDDVRLAKMRAASDFTRARIYVDLAANTYRLDTWQKTGTPGWVTQGGTATLSTGVTFGFGSLTAPPSTLASLAQAPVCEDDSGTAIANTACVIFNSRGTPIDDAGAPTALDAVFLTDGVAVYGITVSATGMSGFWWSPANTAAWTNQ